MGKTSIEWTEFSINPFRARVGNGSGHYCEKVSPGCKNCYSSALQPRFRMPQFQEQRHANVEHFLDVSKLEGVLSRRKPTTYFWCDMTDMFGDWVPNEWIAACFGVMAATPWHTHQVLTKRSKRMRGWFDWADAGIDVGGRIADAFATLAGVLNEDDFDCDIANYINGYARWRGMPDDGNPLNGSVRRWPLPNVVLMVSAEDQQRADERIPDLLATPAAVRGVSAEPLLGPIDFTRIASGRNPHNALTGEHLQESAYSRDWNRIDWVIVGGESGRNARPCDVAWIRSIVEQCKATGVACFVKQLGAYPHHGSDGAGMAYSSLHGRHWRWDENTRPRDLEAMDRLDGAERLVGPGSLYVYAQYDTKGGDPAEWPEDLRVREFPAVPMRRQIDA